MEEKNYVESDEQKQYLGEQIVNKVLPCEGKLGFVEVQFEGDFTPLRLHKNLFDMMVSSEPIPVSDLAEIKWNCLAKQFLALLLEYDLTVLDAASVGRYMNNLIRNTYVDATKKLWDNKTEDNVLLRQVQEVITSK